MLIMDLLAFHTAALDARAVDLVRSEQNWDRRAAEVSQFGLAADDFALTWLQTKMNLQDKTVLDISFGAGRYLQAFLQLGAQVSGVEISRQMLMHTQARLDDSGLRYAPEALLHASWEAVDLAARNWEAAFDLVFLYFSPAISSTQMLEKVLKASRQAVYVSLYVQREDSLLCALQDEFGLTRRSVGADGADDLLHIYNILYQWGYFPQIACEERVKASTHDVDYIFERYASWLFQGQSGDTARRQRLREVLARWARNGKVTTQSRDRVGHLYLDKRLCRSDRTG